MGCGGGDPFVDIPDGLRRPGSTCGGGAWPRGAIASMGRWTSQIVTFGTISRVARGGLLLRLGAVGGVPAGAAIARGDVSKRTPPESSWGGRIALPLAFAARTTDSEC